MLLTLRYLSSFIKIAWIMNLRHGSGPVKAAGREVGIVAVHRG